tara:strand:- start:781 stop:945 length:165 start_codon:yes stop_codon:yes gene_type:complete
MAQIMRQTIKLEDGDRWSVCGREIRGNEYNPSDLSFPRWTWNKNHRSEVFLPYD